MSKNQNEAVTEAVEAAVAPSLGQRLGQWIEDPFASALLATGATLLAITTVLSSMWVISVLIS
ncbi:MAG: hypothetical protein ACI8Z1_003184 [Candidatus Azotimanducaceae bacterium]|jgi:hypothetical protein